MPDELIALFNGQGQSIGAKERTAAYRDGDRVGLVFVWAAWRMSSAAPAPYCRRARAPATPISAASTLQPAATSGPEKRPQQQRTANSPRKSALH